MSAIVLKEYKEYKPLEVLALYKSVYWSLYVNDPDKLKKSYDNSLYTVGAYIDDQLVGMVRVLGGRCYYSLFSRCISSFRLSTPRNRHFVDETCAG